MMKEINLLNPSSTSTTSQTSSTPQTSTTPHSSHSPKTAPTTSLRNPSSEIFDQRFQIKRVIEALLFASSEPISLDKIREITDTIQQLPPRDIRALIQSLQDDYFVQRRAFHIEEIGQGFLLRSSDEFKPYVEQLYRDKRGEKLSQASAEVLAIIAYRQPITRPQIEAIRGVDSSGVVQALLERQLIEPCGKLETAGRPTLYGTTKDFLQHFGLRDLKELPKFEGMQLPQKNKADVADKK